TSSGASSAAGRLLVFIVAMGPCTLDDETGARVPARGLSRARVRPARPGSWTPAMAAVRPATTPGRRWIISVLGLDGNPSQGMPSDDSADSRSDRVSRTAFVAHIRRFLAQRPDRPHWRRPLEGPVLTDFDRGIRAADLGLRTGAGRHDRALAAAVMDALPRGAVRTGRIRPGRGRLC